jgi:hypothetical protein
MKRRTQNELGAAKAEVVWYACHSAIRDLTDTRADIVTTAKRASARIRVTHDQLPSFGGRVRVRERGGSLDMLRGCSAIPMTVGGYVIDARARNARRSRRS